MLIDQKVACVPLFGRTWLAYISNNEMKRDAKIHQNPTRMFLSKLIKQILEF